MFQSGLREMRSLTHHCIQTAQKYCRTPKNKDVIVSYILSQCLLHILMFYIVMFVAFDCFSVAEYKHVHQSSKPRI